MLLLMMTMIANMHSPMRTLSKSDFKLARTCESKLFFRENRYPDARQDDPFLRMLAEGGYMVEALAKAHYPEGRELEYGRDVEQAWHTTREALREEHVTLFEATLLSGRSLARVDILQKQGNTMRLVEVKAASIDYRDHRASLEIGGPGAFRQKRKPNEIVSDYRAYLEDVTFQVVLLERLFPDVRVKPYLMLVDTSAVAKRDGVFDLFDRIDTSAGRNIRAPQFRGSADDLALLSLLAEVDVSREVELLRDEVRDAIARMELLLDAPLSAFEGKHDHSCKSCEFRGAIDEAGNPVSLNGFRECWGNLADVTPHVLELHKVGTLKAADGSSLVQRLKAQGKASLFDVPPEMLVKKDGTMGTTHVRQLRQIEHTRTGTPWVSPELAGRLRNMTYPLHFIDFEASRVALPYHAGMAPYGLLAFQWSCHTHTARGGVPVHREWLNTDAGWPSGEFVRSLRRCVGDEGSLVVWSSFERTTLNTLRDQLEMRGELDADLEDWFSGLDRRLIDIMKFAEEAYFHPLMKGRVSIKVVLDALWQSDPQLREQCAAWLSVPLLANDDPYKALPPLEINGAVQEVHDGTGAIRAYEMMLLTEARHDAPRKAAWAQLLRQYCELDTLSMVLIYEHWRRLVE